MNIAKKLVHSQFAVDQKKTRECRSDFLFPESECQPPARQADARTSELAVPEAGAPWALIRGSLPAAILLLGFFLNLTDAQAKLVPRDKKQDNASTDSFFATNGVVLLRFEVPEAGLASLRKNHRAYVAATLREGDKVYTDVGLHLKGSSGSFRGLDDKPGFTLNFGTLEASDLFHGLKKLHLNNGAQDGTYLSETTCAEFFRSAGLPAGRCTHALVELNGRKLGLYVLLESMDKTFLARHFKNTHGSLYGQSGGGDVSDNLERMHGDEPLTRADLKALAAAANEPDPGRRLAGLRQTLDIDRFLTYMAGEIMLVHWDGYTFARHNYRVYHNRDNDRMVFFPHDMDQMLGDPNVAIEPGVNGLVAQAVMKTPELRAAYRQRFGEMFTNHFQVAVLTNRIHQVVQRALPQLKAYNPNLARDFENNSGSMKSRIMNRAQSLARQFGQPPPQPLKFPADGARLTDWRKQPGNGGGQQDAVALDGKKTLWIKTAGEGGSSWRSRLPLENGRYRFECVAKVKDVPAGAADLKGVGAGLRISGNTVPRKNQLTGNSGWEKLAFEFEVASGPQDVDLVCELRGSKGEVWFEADSLRLFRVQ